MKTPETSRLFTPWTHTNSGVTSYILSERAAPVQQSFYFTHPSFTHDGRFLWLGCGYPPSGGRHAQQVLGLVDFETDELRVFPETQFPSACPVVNLDNGDVYWGNGLDLWKRGPLVDSRCERVNSFPKELVEGRLLMIGTYPTFSADGKSLSIDARFLKDDGRLLIYIGEMPLDGSPFRVWQRIDGALYAHGQFSPTDPHRQLIAYEYWQDHEKEPFNPKQTYHRMWTIRKGDALKPVLKEPVTHSGHEWWDPDGDHIWVVHYGVGIKKALLATGEETLIWPGELSHGHSDRSGRYLVADRMDDPKNPDCIVDFRDTYTGRTVEIVNRPPLDPNLTQCTHLHPHPQFCNQDRYVCHTTTVHDRVDVALVPVHALKSATA